MHLRLAAARTIRIFRFAYSKRAFSCVLGEKIKTETAVNTGLQHSEFTNALCMYIVIMSAKANTCAPEKLIWGIDFATFSEHLGQKRLSLRGSPSFFWTEL